MHQSIQPLWHSIYIPIRQAAWSTPRTEWASTTSRCCAASCSQMALVSDYNLAA